MSNGHSTSHSCVSGHASAPSNDSQMAPMTDLVSRTDIPFAATALRFDDACALHPFSVHKLDAGPVRLMTIAHAFNYRMAVLCLCIEPSWERSRPGLVLFVSDMLGAYGRLLLTVYVWWRTGLLVSSDGLRPVTGEAGGPPFRIEGMVRLMSAD